MTEPRGTRSRMVVPSRGAIGAWALLLAVGVALDGMVGAVPALIVAVVTGARIRRRVLGLLGVGFLVLAGLVVLLSSGPGSVNVDQGFVLDSLVPHHLTFVGLALVSVWTILDLYPHLRATEQRVSETAGGATTTEPLGRWSDVLRTMIVVLVALGGIATVLGVLTH